MDKPMQPNSILLTRNSNSAKQMKLKNGKRYTTQILIQNAGMVYQHPVQLTSGQGELLDINGDITY